jgi:lipoprotein NlpD
MADVRLRRTLLVLALALTAVGCSTPSAPPPVVDRSAPREAEATHYMVRPGDTLYSIAWRYGLDFRDLARFNAIEPPYRIYPNQRLSLRAPAATAPQRPAAPPAQPPVAQAPPAVVPSPAPAQARAPAQPPAPAQRPAPTASTPLPQNQPSPGAPATARPPATVPAVAGWQWPAQGRLLRDYGSGSRSIDLELSPGSRVGAVAAGEVVYAGVGPRGFRHLIIIKHDSAYLSAYSLNEDMHVREGDRVQAGARLAEIRGSGPAAVLRFEIRKDGVPVNPRGLIGRS